MTPRQHFAYVLAREELNYPPELGADPPKPIEPPRWRGAKSGPACDLGAQDWQVTAVGHLVREKQVSGARLVLNLEGFEKSAAAIRGMTPAQWVAAAGEHGGRGPRQALADPAVHDDLKAALRQGVFPAFEGVGCSLCINMGAQPFVHGPPDARYYEAVAPEAPIGFCEQLRGKKQAFHLTALWEPEVLEEAAKEAVSWVRRRVSGHRDAYIRRCAASGHFGGAGGIATAATPMHGGGGPMSHRDECRCRPVRGPVRLCREMRRTATRESSRAWSFRQPVRRQYRLDTRNLYT